MAQLTKVEKEIVRIAVENEKSMKKTIVSILLLQGNLKRQMKTELLESLRLYSSPTDWRIDFPQLMQPLSIKEKAVYRKRIQEMRSLAKGNYYLQHFLDTHFSSPPQTKLKTFILYALFNIAEFGQGWLDIAENDLFAIMASTYDDYLEYREAYSENPLEDSIFDASWNDGYSEKSPRDRIIDSIDKVILALLLQLEREAIGNPTFRELENVIEGRLKVQTNDVHRHMETYTTMATNHGLIMAYAHLGECLRHISVLDNRTTELCRARNGKVFHISQAVRGITVPPLHWRCFDKKTEILTNSGWKLFKDLSFDDLVYTIDPETEIPEWQKPTNYISYHYTGDLIHFKNNQFDLKVIPEHNMLVRSRDNSTNDKRWKLRMAKDIGRKSKWQMSGGANWVGHEPTHVKLGGREVPVEAYVKFMGWWLSEGSTTQKSKNYWTVKICQHKDNTIEDDLKDLPFELRKVKDGYLIHNSQLGKELKKFGHSHQKFVPDTIKRLSPRLITLFLECYIKGDGSVAKGKFWKGYQFNDSISISTSSPQMSADLGELIMKAGGRPSYSIEARAGVAHQFSNGVYIINHDLHTVRWNKAKYSWVNNMKITDVPYDDMVYSVEVEKYNTLLVRRNGKVAWSGNCRSIVVPDDCPPNITVL